MEPLLAVPQRQTLTLKDKSEIQFFFPRGRHENGQKHNIGHELSGIMDVLKHRRAHEIQTQHIWCGRQRGGLGGAYFHRDSAH